MSIRVYDCVGTGHFIGLATDFDLLCEMTAGMPLARLVGWDDCGDYVCGDATREALLRYVRSVTRKHENGVPEGNFSS